MKVRSIVAAVFALAPVTALLTIAEPAVAEPEMSLEEKKQWAEMQKLIDAKAEAATKACGTKITASFDVASFKGTDLMKDSPTAACRDAVSNVGNLCTTSAGKDAVKASVETITCRKSSDGTRVTREGKALTVAIDRQHSSIQGKKPGSYSWKSALEEIL